MAMPVPKSGVKVLKDNGLDAQKLEKDNFENHEKAVPGPSVSRGRSPIRGRDGEDEEQQKPRCRRTPTPSATARKVENSLLNNEPADGRCA